MQGIFIKPKKVALIFNIAILLAGIGIIGFCITGLFFRNAWKAEDRLAPIYLLIFGVIAVFFECFVLSFNKNAELFVNEEYFRAKFAWGNKSNFPTSHIKLVHAGLNMLAIVLDSGKRITIMRLQNAPQLYEYISHIIEKMGAGKACKMELAEVRSEWEKLKGRKKKAVIAIICGIIVMVGLIVITVVLTGAKEISDFSNKERIIFGVFIVCEVITLVLLFVFAQRAGLANRALIELVDIARRTVIEQEKLPPGNVYKVFADSDDTMRITIMSIPRSKSVYYIHEDVGPGPYLHKTEESSIFDSIDDLSISFEWLHEVHVGGSNADQVH